MRCISVKSGADDVPFPVTAAPTFTRDVGSTTNSIKATNPPRRRTSSATIRFSSQRPPLRHPVSYVRLSGISLLRRELLATVRYHTPELVDRFHRQSMCFWMVRLPGSGSLGRGEKMPLIAKACPIAGIWLSIGDGE
jgi:hypothetical protein